MQKCFDYRWHHLVYSDAAIDQMRWSVIKTFLRSYVLSYLGFVNHTHICRFRMLTFQELLRPCIETLKKITPEFHTEVTLDDTAFHNWILKERYIIYTATTKPMIVVFLKKFTFPKSSKNNTCKINCRTNTCRRQNEVFLFKAAQEQVQPSTFYFCCVVVVMLFLWFRRSCCYCIVLQSCSVLFSLVLSCSVLFCPF